MLKKLDRADIEIVLTTSWLGRHFLLFDAVPSTNDALSAAEQDDVPEGTMIAAEFQSAGRGRLGRKWSASPGSSLLLSLLFRPRWPIEQAQWLMMIAGLSITKAIGALTSLEACLKWPNDVVVGSGPPWRKCGGILLELSILERTVESAVVGIGLNVNIAESELKRIDVQATSLQVELGKRIRRPELLGSILQYMEDLYEQAADGNSPVQEWKNHLVNLNRLVRTQNMENGTVIEGMAVDADSMGRLLVQDSSGKLHKLSAGDVTIVS